MRLLSAIKSASRLKHVPLNDGISLEQLSEDPGTDILSLPELVRHDPEDLILAKESKEELRAASSRCLSRFEIKVLDLYLEGLSYREIAERLCRNAKSVDNAVQRIRRKLAYAERGFQNEPQRCKACRDARKNAARGPREFFTATCAACGGEARVPFEPKSDRPVYCSECFAKMREQA